MYVFLISQSFSQLLFLTLVVIGVSCRVVAQESPQKEMPPTLWKQTQIEIGIGYTTPFLFGGRELERSKNLRTAGQSYFERPDGSRADVGSYSRSSGFSLGLSFYKPTEIIDGLMLGGSVKTSLTGSQPQIGGYDEAYFFNFLLASASIKYYPIRPLRLFVATDFGLASVFTKNRFKNAQGEQNFFHQFGIGMGGSFSVGYTFSIFSGTPLSLISQYDWFRTRVEVNGIGDDSWTFGALNVILKFGI